MLGQHHHGHGRVLPGDVQGCHHPLVGMGRRHTDVDDRDSGPMHGDVAQEIVRVVRLRDDVEA